MCIGIISFPVDDAKYFGITLNFFIKPFSYMIKKIKGKDLTKEKREKIDFEVK